jgi:hypothetical protein
MFKLLILLKKIKQVHTYQEMMLVRIMQAQIKLIFIKNYLINILGNALS